MGLTSALTLSDVECEARRGLDSATWAYVAGGAGSEATLRGNRAAFQSVWLRPRILTSSSATPNTTVHLFGRLLSLPVVLAPTSPQRLLHQDAELATARGASAAGSLSIVSSDSHYPFPDIARAAEHNCWFQLYPYESKATIESMIDLAVEAGAGAIVVTVDANYSARRIRASRAGFCTPPQVDFGTLRALGVLRTEVPTNGRLTRIAMTWQDLEWIRSRTSGPLLVKGVLHPDDARRCIEGGADGVIVSNHGGRQLDGVIPSLFALEQVADEIGDRAMVLMDGGVRSGIDVVKALALGADAVCIGRPYLWGLAVAGEVGVTSVLNLMRDEIADALRQLGAKSIKDIGRDHIVPMPWHTGTEPTSSPADEYTGLGSDG